MGDDYGDGRLNFYYSRENRLKNAPKAVRDFHEQGPPQKKGLFRTLTATKPLRLMFISILVISAAVFIIFRFLSFGDARALGGNKLTFTIVGAGDNSYIMLKKNVPDGGNADVYTGPVDIAFSIPGEGNPIHAQRVYFGPEEEELFRFVTPFRGGKMLVLMEAGPHQIHFTVSYE
jgi:hypothetical protein